MKRILKSIICLALAALMAFSGAAVAMAKENVVPVILIHGLGANPVYENVGTDEQKEIANLGLGDDIASAILGNQTLICEFLKMLDPARDVDEDALIESLKALIASSTLN